MIYFFDTCLRFFKFQTKCFAFFQNLLKQYENLRGWIPVFLLYMQNCSRTLDKGVRFLSIRLFGRYIVRMKTTITRSTHIRSGSHLFVDNLNLV